MVQHRSRPKEGDDQFFNARPLASQAGLIPVESRGSPYRESVTLYSAVNDLEQ